jgi:1-deoxy-D-xylulose-5-phosphate synthase
MSIIDSLDLPDGLKKLTESELYLVAKECREIIIETISKNGGHLSPNLGVVELTVAIHASLSSPKDKIIWDVGHQSYTHKLLTGRLHNFETIRQYNGISGFPKRTESEHDIVSTGHAGTALSSALGIAKARELEEQKYAILSVIGDASITCGESFEAINNIDEIKKGSFIVILNDNEMSISESVGLVSEHITSLRYNLLYRGFKKKAESIIKKLPKGEPLAYSIEKLIRRTKHLLINYKKIGVIYEELGFRYLGPIDAHNIAHLMSAINYGKQAKEPVLIHVLSKKGYGYKPAEKNPTKFHGLGKFEPSTGEPINKSYKLSYTDIFSQKIVDLSKKDQKIIAITAAMEEGTGLHRFKKNFPDRFVDVGMSEEHAITFACGLAIQGYKPIIAIYSTFMQRSFDQIIHDIALQNLPVILIMDRAGLVGEDGPTHHGVFDISFMRIIPNFTVLAPKDHLELQNMLDYAVKKNSPVSIRYPKSYIPEIIMPEKELYSEEIELLIANEASSVTIFACGSMVLPFYELITENNYQVNLVNIRFIKPFDVKNSLKLLKKSKIIVTAEEGIITGGIFGIISEIVALHNISAKVYPIGIKNDNFVTHGNKEQLLSLEEMDKLSLKKIIERLL